jgi:hypothetical protein
MAKVKLAKVSVEDLKKEIARRQRKLPTLIAARDALDCQIAELEVLGPVKPPVRRRKKAGRPKGARKAIKRAVVKPARAGSLASKLAQVFQGKKNLSLGDAIKAVLAAGYKTKSKNFATIVGMTLAKDKRFGRVRKGVYALKG